MIIILESDGENIKEPVKKKSRMIGNIDLNDEKVVSLLCSSLSFLFLLCSSLSFLFLLCSSLSFLFLLCSSLSFLFLLCFLLSSIVLPYTPMIFIILLCPTYYCRIVHCNSLSSFSFSRNRLTSNLL